jgi:hypothetical protein
MPVTNTYAGTTFWACAAAQANDLNAAGFAALSWVQVTNCASTGEWSTSDNILNYPTLDTTVQQKQKGIRNGGDPVVEVGKIKTDAGQNLLRAQADTKLYYAFKRVLSDGDTEYGRGLVAGPEKPGGEVEGFIVQRFTLGFVQQVITV